MTRITLDNNIQERFELLENNIIILTDICKNQEKMIKSLTEDSSTANLENRKGSIISPMGEMNGNSELSSEEEDNLNKNRIRRRITINDTQVWVTGNTEQEYAENVLRLMTKGLKTEQPKAGHEFKTYAERWFQVFSKPNVETVTATTYERQLRLYLYPALEGKNIEDICPGDVQKMLNSITGAKETKMKARMVLNQIMEQAVEEDIITKNPVLSKTIRITGTASKPTKPYSVEQMQYIVAHIDDVKEPLDRAFLVLLSLHPLRLEEVLGLKQEDIDRERRILHIQRAVTHPTRNMPEIKATKTEASRRDIEMVKEIISYLPTGQPDDFLLGGKTPLSYTQVRSMCRRIERDIAFPEKITPIRFRTTVLTDIYDETKDIKKAQAAAGHTTSAMTLKHYVHGRQPQCSTAAPISRRYGLSKEAAV